MLVTSSGVSDMTQEVESASMIRGMISYIGARYASRAHAPCEATLRDLALQTFQGCNGKPFRT